MTDPSDPISSPPSPQPERRNSTAATRARQRSLKIAGIYAACGFLWIALSDRLLASLVQNGDMLTRLQTYKGWFFVGVTAGLVFLFTRRALLEPERSRETIRQSEERYRVLFENANMAALIIDPSDGAILDTNEAAAAFYGWTRERLRDMRMSQINTLTSDEVRKWMEEVKNGERTTLIFQHRRADGSVRDVEVHSGPIPFEGRTALFSIVHDVTERRQAEEALHGRTYGLQTLLEASRNLAITLDLDTVLQATTDGVAKLFGLDTAAIYLLEGDVLCLGATTPPLPSNFPEELRNAQLSDHPLIRKTITTGTPTLVPDMRTADLTPAERSVAEQRGLRTVLYFPLVVGVKSVGTLIVGSIERTRVVKDAEIDLCRTLANLAALAVENARLYESRKQYAARLSQQITEHRMLEDQLRQSQKMESIGTLAGGVAHDFNNLLTAINGYGHIALLKMAKDDPNRLNVEQILEATDRAAHLTKDLLLFSRKQPLDRKPLDLNDIVRRLERFIARIIGEDITCATRLQAGEIPVLVDGHQLEQVLMNLATNARDAMAKGGVLTLATETMTIDETFVALHGYGRPGRYALLTVADTGCGMDPEVRKRIFEPFYTTKEVGKGTGLGLAVVYGIVTQHEGFMNVYSEPGSGTTFQIYLLLTGACGDTSLDRSRVADIARGNETILVAEDDAAVRGMIESVLTDFGYTVITAVDGADAVEKYRANSGSIQLLLLDLVMPHKSGREAFDEIVAITPGVSVLFASGYSPDIVRDKASLLAAAEIIYKPVTPGELLRKIRGMLDEKQGT